MENKQIPGFTMLVIKSYEDGETPPTRAFSFW
jgi:hypothetical protein